MRTGPGKRTLSSFSTIFDFNEKESKQKPQHNVLRVAFFKKSRRKVQQSVKEENWRKKGVYIPVDSG